MENPEELSEKLISEYIQRVLDIRRKSGDGSITQDLLEEVAASVGILTEKDVEILQKSFHKHLNLGYEYATKKNWLKAYEEFDAASDLFPNDINALLVSAQITAIIWEKTGEEKYKQETIEYCQRILNLNPHESMALRIFIDIEQETQWKRLRKKIFGQSWESRFVKLQHSSVKFKNTSKNNPPETKKEKIENTSKTEIKDAPPKKLTKEEREKIIAKNTPDSPLKKFKESRNLGKANIQKVFYQALAENNIAIIKIAIEQGADINGLLHQNGLLPLTFALANNANKVVDILLENGADVNNLDKSINMHAAFYAIAMNNSAALKKILEQGAKRDAMFIHYSLESYAETCGYKACLKVLRDTKHIENNPIQNKFHQALAANNIEMTEALIAQGTNVNEPLNEDGLLPLTVAVSKNSNRLLDILLENGADVNKRDNTIKTPLSFYAIEINSPIMLEKILRYGANRDAMLMHYSLESYTEMLGYKACLKVLQKMLPSENSSPKQTISSSFLNKFIQERELSKANIQTVFYKALAENNIKISELAIEQGADINTNKGTGELLPLFFTLEKQSNKMFDFLIERGADIYITDTETAMPIGFYAIKMNNDYALGKLIDAGINTQEVYNDFTLSDYAKYGKATKCTKVLDEKSEKKINDIQEHLYNAIYRGDLVEVKIAIAKGANPNSVGNVRRMKPLGVAMMYIYYDIFNYLISVGADPKEIDPYLNISYLFYAAALNNTRFVETLIQYGDTSEKFHDMTLYQYAKTHNAQSVCSLLEKKNLI